LTLNLRNFLRTLTPPEVVSHWSLAALRDRPVKIGAKIVRHGRSITFQVAEIMVPRTLFRQILDAVAALRPFRPTRCGVPPQSLAAQTVSMGIAFVCRPTQPTLRSDSNHRPAKLAADPFPTLLSLKTLSDGGYPVTCLRRLAADPGNVGSHL
jgi:hypothetical protein